MKKTTNEKLVAELRLTTRRMTRIATALAFGGMTGLELSQLVRKEMDEADRRYDGLSEAQFYLKAGYDELLDAAELAQMKAQDL